MRPGGASSWASAWDSGRDDFLVDGVIRRTSIPEIMPFNKTLPPITHILEHSFVYPLRLPTFMRPRPNSFIASRRSSLSTSLRYTFNFDVLLSFNVQYPCIERLCSYISLVNFNCGPRLSLIPTPLYQLHAILAQIRPRFHTFQPGVRDGQEHYVE